MQHPVILGRRVRRKLKQPPDLVEQVSGKATMLCPRLLLHHRGGASGNTAHIRTARSRPTVRISF